jgi:ParB family chromosome partitioning protein
MTKAKTKPARKPATLTLAPSTMIPLDKLVPSSANVRKVKAGVSIEQLAESIARRSLLQSLSVRPVLDADGSETGTYEVQAGSRRLRALHLLAKQKRLARNAPVPCIIKTAGILEDDSLAENTDREALHPLDQFRAFAALCAKGQAEEDIAAACGVSSTVVRQRLKLASASPKLLDAYAEDALNLEQLMAFCITDDHARQEQVFEALTRREFHPFPQAIRRMLTETCVEASDRRALFVGVEAYEAAGGIVLHDLFDEDDDDGWFQDPALLMRLVSEKLAAEREAILAQGWKWVEAADQVPHELRFRLRRITPIGDALSDAEQEGYGALTDEYDAIAEGRSEDEIPDDARARLKAIEAELAEMDRKPPKFAAEDMARAGVLIGIDHDGRLKADYGLVRPEDMPLAAPETDPATGGEDAEYAGNGAAPPSETPDEDSEDPAGKPLPDRLIQDLTAHRTVALRNALADDYPTAFLAVLHAICLNLFYPYGTQSCLQIKANDAFPAKAGGLSEMAATKAIEQRHQHWQTKLPEDPRDLWAALLDLDHQGSLGALFAHCASLTVNAVREPHQPRRDALRHADALATALSLDMTAAGWTTTAENYLGRITKARILDAVRDAKGESTARLIEHLKKSDMAKEAERLLQGTGWLPEPLRTATETPSPADGDEPATPPALPAFLTNGAAQADQTPHPAAE